MGKDEQSRKYLQQQLLYSQAQEPTGSVVDAFQIMNIATCQSYLGDHDVALETSRQAMELLPREKDHIFGAVIENNHTLLLARAGQREEALERLTNSVDGLGSFTRWELYLDPAWDFFRDDERFNELAKPLNLKETGQ